MDSLTFLGNARRSEPFPVFVVHGDEAFLKRRVLTVLRQELLGPENEDFGLSVHPGERADWATIQDELHTLPFLSSRRVVIVEQADTFVTRHRPALEKYVGKPASAGVLILDVKTWAATTKLAKLVSDQATLVCKAPAAAKLAEWCRQWAKEQYQKQLAAPAAQLLVELVGGDMGLLDQELAKLAVYVGEANKIESKDVDQLVGNNRSENTFKIFEMIGAGKVADALGLLDHLLSQGEEPLKLLAAFGWQLRKLAQAARLHWQGATLPTALQEAGFNQWAARSAEQQLRHLGRARLEKLFDWLLEVDLGLKGGSGLPPRTLLERLVLRLARPVAKR